MSAPNEMVERLLDAFLIAHDRPRDRAAQDSYAQAKTALMEKLRPADEPAAPESSEISALQRDNESQQAASNEQVLESLMPRRREPPEPLRNCHWCGSKDVRLYVADEKEYAQCHDCTACGPDHVNGRHWNTLACICMAHPKTGDWLRINCPVHGNRWDREELERLQNARPSNEPTTEIDRLRRVEAAALRVASSRRDGVVTDRAALDRLDAVLEGRA